MRALTLEQLATLVGQPLGESAPVVVDQARIDAFAAATEDRQWIHVDPQRAAAGPFGGTVAHGYLTLSLLPVLLNWPLVLMPVLFANRVSPGRFMLSLGLNAVLNVINLLIWGVTVSVLAWLLYSISIPIWSACVIILLGSAPLVFAFLTLLPYLGVPLSWVLEIWSFIIVIVFLGDLVALTLPQAFV